MKKIKELQKDIKKLEESLTSSAMPDNMIAAAESKLVELRAKLKELEEEQSQADADKQAKEEAEAAQKQEEEAKKKADMPKPKKKIADCSPEELAALKAELAEAKRGLKPATPSKKTGAQRQFGTRLRDGVVSDIGRAITQRLKEAGSAQKLDVAALEKEATEVLQLGKSFLRALKKLGGEKATESWLGTLEKEIKERIERLKTKNE